jgi:hypothetical protein
MLKSSKLLVGALIMIAPALCTTLDVSPASTNTNLSQTVSFDIDVSDISDLYSWQFDFGFDPTVLSAVSITEGPFLPSGGSTFFIPGTIDNTGGSIKFIADTLIGSVPGVNGSGTLATIQFDTIGAGVSSLTLANITLLDSNLTDLDFASMNGSITVKGSTAAVPEPNSLIFTAVGLGLLVVAQIRKAKHTRSCRI